ncbi:MAG: phosphate ABC transporter permease PstA [Planctomycetaceae bacterium]|nr:phosphate ABC transporter permease PstA [Planctomycetaceae bacterium]
MSVPTKLQEPHLARRHRIGKAFEWVCCGSTWFGVVVLGVLLLSVGWKALTWPPAKAKPANSSTATVDAQSTSAPLSTKFFSSYDSRKPREAGILAAIWGSLWLIVLVALFSVPIGVGSAVYLEEYSNEGRLKRIIQVNLSNLAGVPSIVYALLGMTAFVKMFGFFTKDEGKSLVVNLLFTTVDVPLPFDRTLISGALTLTLLVLPTVIVASQEALRAVPSSIRTASYALGATQWQTIRYQVVPAAMPGIMTGVILALSRAMGEAAPLMLIGALTYVAYTPGDITSVSDIFKNPHGLLDAPFDKFTALPLQIYQWINHPRAEYAHLAAAGIMVLLTILLLMNTVAIVIRHKFQKSTRW